MARIGCLVFLAALGLLALEVYVYLVFAHWAHGHFESINGYLEPLILIVVDGVIGVRIAQRAIAQAPMAMMTGGAGRLIVRAVGGVLIAFPGLVSDVLGLLLILPGLSHVFGRLGDKIAASIMKRSLQKMFGAAGGAKMPPGMAFPFPGMKPDDRVGGGPKTYDTTAEVDKKD